MSEWRSRDPGGGRDHAGGVDDVDGVGWRAWRRAHSTGLVSTRIREKLLRLRRHVWRDPVPLASAIRRRWGGDGAIPWVEGIWQPMLLAPTFGVIRRKRTAFGLSSAAPPTQSVRAHSDHAVARGTGALAGSVSDTELRETTGATAPAIVLGTRSRDPIATGDQRPEFVVVPARRGPMPSFASPGSLAGSRLPVPMAMRHLIPASRGIVAGVAMAGVSQRSVAAPLGRDRLRPLRTEAGSLSVQERLGFEKLAPVIGVGRGVVVPGRHGPMTSSVFPGPLVGFHLPVPMTPRHFITVSRGIVAGAAIAGVSQGRGASPFERNRLGPLLTEVRSLSVQEQPESEELTSAKAVASGEPPASAVVHRAASGAPLAAAAPPGDTAAPPGNERIRATDAIATHSSIGGRGEQTASFPPDSVDQVTSSRGGPGGADADDDRMPVVRDRPSQGTEQVVELIVRTVNVAPEVRRQTVASNIEVRGSDVASEAPAVTAPGQVGGRRGESSPAAIEGPFVYVQPRPLQRAERYPAAIAQLGSRLPLGTGTRDVTFTSRLTRTPLSVRPVFRRADSTGEGEPRAFPKTTGTLAVTALTAGDSEAGDMASRRESSVRGDLLRGRGMPIVRTPATLERKRLSHSGTFDSPSSRGNADRVFVDISPELTAERWAGEATGVEGMAPVLPHGRSSTFGGGAGPLRREESTAQRAAANWTGESRPFVGVRESLRSWQPLHHGGSSSTRLGGIGESVRRATRDEARPDSLIVTRRIAPTPADGRVVVSTESIAVSPAPSTGLAPEQVSPSGSTVEVVVSSQAMPPPQAELIPGVVSRRSMDRSGPNVVRRIAAGSPRDQTTGQAAPRGTWYGVPLGRLPVMGGELRLARVVPWRGITMTKPGSTRWPEWSTAAQRLGPSESAGGTFPLTALPVAADQSGPENLAPARLLRRSDDRARLQQPAEPPTLQEASYEVSLGTALPVVRDTSGRVAGGRTVDSSILRVAAELPSPPRRASPVDAGAQVRDVEAATAAPNVLVDLDELVEKAWQTLMRRLTIERERRGYTWGN